MTMSAASCWSRRAATLAALAIAAVLVVPGTALAAHVTIELEVPERPLADEPIELTAIIRTEAEGAAVEGAEVAFYLQASIAGVDGEAPLGTAITDSAGVATLERVLGAGGDHTLRAEVTAGGTSDPVETTLSIAVERQLSEPEAGISIPGLGAWLVQGVIGTVWATMVVALAWVVVVARDGRRSLLAAQGNIGLLRRSSPGIPEWAVIGKHPPYRISLAHAIVFVLLIAGGALLTLLVRGPNTHANTNPDEYDNRTPVAFVGAPTAFHGPGVIPSRRTGDAITYGQVLYIAHGCAGCHGIDAAGGAVAQSPAFVPQEALEQLVRFGLGGMPAYDEGALPDNELDYIYAFLRAAREEIGEQVTTTTTTSTTTTTVPETTTTTGAGTPSDTGATTTTAVATVTFAEVAAILEPNCAVCHGDLGGWDASTRESVINSGDNGPAVIPGDSGASLLVAKLLGTAEIGELMPPTGSLPAEDIDLIIDWIDSGAPE